MNKLNKYPFKSMKNIKNAFYSLGIELGISDLLNVSNACYSDTYEVTEMIAYLMAFGQIQRIDDGWVRNKELPNKPNEPWRVHFLKEILTIIKILDPVTPKNEEQIADESNVDIDTIKEFLPFLAEITDRGYIVSKPSAYHGKFILLSAEMIQSS